MGGCATTPRGPTYGWHGQEQAIVGVYAVDTLHSQLPEIVPPQSVRAAAERTLRARGYTITTSEATNDRTRVVARPPDARLFKRVIVGSSLAPQGTRVSVHIEPGGNETTSRDMLDSILTLLGH
jgi:hypothetical protein